MLHIINKYLTQNNYVHLIDEFNENYYSHPNYPSLFAFTDTLSLLQIENIAVQVPKVQLEKLPDHFIANISLNNFEKFVLVNKKKEMIQYETDDKTKHTVSINKFKDIWRGLVVAIEKNKNDLSIKKSEVYNTFYSFASVICIIFFISFLFQDGGISLFLFKIISFLGLSIGFFILQEKYAQGNSAVSKICDGGTNTSCNSVIKTDFGLKWIGFSDMPILFFSTNLTAICLNLDVLPYIGLFSLLAIPVIAYSIFLQGVKLKKWCLLCLGVSGLVLIQAIYFIININDFNFKLAGFIEYSLLFIIFTSIWYSFRYLLKERKDFIDKNKRLSRFKRNFSLFKFLSKEIGRAEKLNVLNPITLGKKESPLNLSLFLSPSCGHCHTAYKEARDLMAKYPTIIKLHIFYNLNPENLQNPFVRVAKTIFEINQSSNEAENALNDWHIKQMKLEEWLEKWEQQIIGDSVEIILKEQYQWCQKNNLNFTPVKLINDKPLPKEYNVDELKYFLNDLIEEKNIEKEVLQV